MHSLGTHFTNLKYLDLRERTEGFPGSGLSALADLKLLTCLSLTDVRWLHDSVLAEIAKKGLLKVCNFFHSELQLLFLMVNSDCFLD